MVYPKIALAIGVCAFISTLFGDSRSSWNAEFKEAIKHTFAGDRTLDVDNINGFIHIIGDNGTNIRVEGEKVIRALNQQEIDRAKREVTLDLNEKNGIAQVYVNGPFRDHGSRSDNHGFHEHNDHDYEVTYNFTIHVPRDTALELRNVNGATTTEQTRGHFNLHGVNGAVTMTSVAGSGKVNTVNGPVVASFRENPKEATDFKTVNGRIEASFQPNLAADLRFKTMNGQVYTDFESTGVPSPPSTPGTRKDGRFVFKTDRATSVRVGAGGPELSFQTLNGSINIRTNNIK
jgi:hypothetical protein